MLFLVNKEKKIIFGWSAKCGCSHIKNIFYFLESGVFCESNQSVHRGKGKDFQQIPENLEEYTLFLFIRNPYKRLVSGFLDKYNPNGEFYSMWNCYPHTFSNFVNAVLEKDQMIDKHHFTPQTGEHFNSQIKIHSNKFIYDIENIDYKHIEGVFNTIIPKKVLQYRGIHYKNYFQVFLKNIPNLEIEGYYKIKPLLQCFYNDEIKKKVYDIYKEDFDFFEENGFDYVRGTNSGEPRFPLKPPP
jgi:hypothetical protein